MTIEQSYQDWKNRVEYKRADNHPDFDAELVIVHVSNLKRELATIYAENARLMDETERTRNIMSAEIEKLQSALENRLFENLRTHTILKDWVEQHNKIINNQCPPDEKHCTCVPSLYAEIERLRAALEKYAVKEDWYEMPEEYADRAVCFECDGAGYDIAREALKRP